MELLEPAVPVFEARFGIEAEPVEDSFRNHGAFHEACTMLIAQRLIATLDPVRLRIGGYWYPRGGMPIDVFYQTGTPPEGTWIPAQEVAPYRGRG